jgi:DNA polymerase IV
MERTILHLDMDAFYASVEQRDNPSLRGQPVIVGAPPERRGVVCAASYEARAFGVRSAMPSRTAAAKCPQGIFLRPRMDHYRAESRRIMDLIATFDVRIEQVSVDEAYLEAGGLLENDEARLRLAREMKTLIRSRCGLAASIGIGPNKLLAKIASDQSKPDGLLLVTQAEASAFLRPLPASAIHGVGRVTAAALAKAGLHTVGDIQNHRGDLRAIVGTFAPVLAAHAMGIDHRPLEFDGAVKSISAEETFQQDTADRRILVPLLRSQAASIAAKLAREHLAARTVQVKVRYSDFTTLTRQTSVEEPTDDAGDLYTIACAILRRTRIVDRPLRLLGLGVSNLGQPCGQLRLLP